MIRVLVIGAAGMIGRKLVQRLVADGAIGEASIAALSLVDVVAASPVPAPESVGGLEVESIVADVAEPDAADRAARE